MLFWESYIHKQKTKKLLSQKKITFIKAHTIISVSLQDNRDNQYTVRLSTMYKEHCPKFMQR